MTFIPTIMENNAIITSYHASEAEPCASPLDIADAAFIMVNFTRNDMYSIRIVVICGSKFSSQSSMEWICRIRHTTFY